MISSRANFTFTILLTSYHSAKAPIHPYHDRPEQTAHYRPQTHLMATAQRNKGTTVLRSKTVTDSVSWDVMPCHWISFLAH